METRGVAGPAVQESGERYLLWPADFLSGHEHVHRYLFARRYAANRRVLDVACGEGYGAALLAEVARSVVGVDRDGPIITHAQRTYRAPNLQFIEGLAEQLPVEPASVDLAISFETIEHLTARETFLDELKRVLAPGGILLVSTPNRRIYNEVADDHNPFHTRELTLDEFSALLAQCFEHVRILGQEVVAASFIVPADGRDEHIGDGNSGISGARSELLPPPGAAVGSALPPPRYFLAICSDHPLAEAEPDLALDTSGAVRGALEGAWQALGVRDRELRDTLVQVNERSAQLTDAWDKLRQRDQQLDEAWAAIRERDERTETAWMEVAERNRQLETAWATLAEHDQQLETAWATLAERNQQLDEAWKVAADREQELQRAWNTVAQRDGQLQDAWAAATERAQRLEQAERVAAEREARIATLEAQDATLEVQADESGERIHLLQHYADLGAVYRAQLAEIQSSFAYALLTGAVWPTARRVPWRVRQLAKRGLRVAGRELRVLRLVARRSVRASEAAPGLICGIDTDITRPVEIGKGSILLLQGWCYHPVHRIRRLEVVVGGVAQRATNYGIVKPDVLRDQAPHTDQRGYSLNSGFAVALRLDAVPEPCVVQILLRAYLSSGRRCEVPVGSLELTPGATCEAPTAPPPSADGGPLVAICMATYNPPARLFQMQVDSIRRQSHQNWVCIINDDCSSEDAHRMIRETVAGDARFFVYRNDRRLGFYHNFEAALRHVPPEAEYVALSDQDDKWYSDKLRACLEAFDPDTMLVFTDQDIVAEDGEVTSNTYWVTRKNNYTDFTTLLFANTVTGAASVFRATLLRDALPFPPRVGDSFHDHWIATVAMAKGRLGYIDRPMYAYTQHAANVLGHFAGGAAWRFLPRWSSLLGSRRNFADAKARARLALWSKRDVYFNDVLRLVVIARTLRMRLPGIASDKRRILARFSRFDHSLTALVREGMARAISRRPTLGAEWYCLRGAVANQALNRYYRASRRRIYRHVAAEKQIEQAVPKVLVDPGPGPVLALAADPVAPKPMTHDTSAQPGLLANAGVIEQKIAPLTLAVSAREPRRVNLLVPTIDFRYLFGGYIGKLNLALQLKRHGYDVRMVIVDWCDYNPAAWRRQLATYQGLETFLDQIEVTYGFDRSVPLPVHPDDAFIATTWWTAHIAHRAVRDLGHKRFVYLIQEYEPMTFPMGSFYAVANETYTFPHFAVFSTELLRDYFRQGALGVFAEDAQAGECHSVAFDNAIHKFDIHADVLRQRTSRRLLFYARPEQHAARNMFEVGILALQKAIHQGLLAGADWELHGTGTIGDVARIELAPGRALRLMPRVSLEEYYELLPRYDVGLSLMLTPHPSLVPLEMAGAGLLTVTNTYANKTAERLAALSGNLIAVSPTVSGVVAGLAEAVRNVGDSARRVDGSRVAWATTWDTSFGAAVMAKLHTYLECSDSR